MSKPQIRSLKTPTVVGRDNSVTFLAQQHQDAYGLTFADESVDESSAHKVTRNKALILILQQETKEVLSAPSQQPPSSCGPVHTSCTLSAALDRWFWVVPTGPARLQNPEETECGEETTPRRWRHQGRRIEGIFLKEEKENIRGRFSSLHRSAFRSKHLPRVNLNTDAGWGAEDLLQNTTFSPSVCHRHGVTEKLYPPYLCFSIARFSTEDGWVESQHRLSRYGDNFIHNISQSCKNRKKRKQFKEITRSEVVNKRRNIVWLRSLFKKKDFIKERLG